MDVLYKLHRSNIGLSALVALAVWMTAPARAQERDQYIMGESGRLEMVVYIIGEVKRPGEYQVPDNTNLLELISKAGGQTEFSNLGAVTITRLAHNVAANGANGNGRLHTKNRIIRYDVKAYLSKSVDNPPPVLKPGDTVLIPRNNWHKWRTAFTIIRDLSVIASVYLLYLRVK